VIGFAGVDSEAPFGVQHDGGMDKEIGVGGAPRQGVAIVPWLSRGALSKGVDAKAKVGVVLATGVAGDEGSRLWLAKVDAAASDKLGKNEGLGVACSDEQG
jgi:hypothetical protein